MKTFFLGVDVGGTKTNVGLVSPRGKLIRKEKTATRAKSEPRIIISTLCAAIDRVWTPEVVAIGVGIAGLVDHQKGMFVHGPNFSPNFRNVQLAHVLEKKYQRPVTVDNDAHCFIVGEHAHGAGREYENIVGMTIGTGVGGGIIINGALYRGNNNGAGEIGHTTLLESSEKCSCGGIGHLEAAASGSAMIKMFLRETGRSIDVPGIEKLVEAQDDIAKKIVERARHALAAGIANVIHTLNPEAIILGGGMIRFSYFMNRLTREIQDNLTFAALKLTPVMRGDLGDSANILGAARLARDLAKRMKKA